MTRPALFAVLLPLAACGHDSPAPAGTVVSTATVASCITQYSPQNGYGYASDGTIATSPGAGGAAPTPPDAAELAVQGCLGMGGPILADGGAPAPGSGAADPTSCDKTKLITRDAALCIAKVDKLATGISPWTAALTFNQKFRRIIWNVMSTTASNGAGTASGTLLTIDAITGETLATSSWGSTP